MTAASPPPPTTEVSQQFSMLISNAFGIVAALAWSDAINGSMQKLQVFKTNPLLGPFVYAAVITLLAYVAGRALSGYLKQPCTQLCKDPPA